jgi:hypothetical protein
VDVGEKAERRGVSLPSHGNEVPPGALSPLDAPPTHEELAWWETQSTMATWKFFAIRCVGGGGFVAIARVTRGLLGTTPSFQLNKELFSVVIGIVAATLVSGAMMFPELRKERDRRIRQRRIRAALAPDRGTTAEQALAVESRPPHV